MRQALVDKREDDLVGDIHKPTQNHFHLYLDDTVFVNFNFHQATKYNIIIPSLVPLDNKLTV